MRVFLGELRKVFWLRNLLIAATVGALYYWVFIWQLVEVFPNGHPATEIHQITIALHTEFGPTLEPDEIQVLAARQQKLISQADALIAADPTLTAGGFQSWASLETAEDPTPDVDTSRWTLLFNDTGIGWRIEATAHILDNYAPIPTPAGTSDAEVARITQINQSQEWRNLQSPVLLDFLGVYPKLLTTLVFLVVLLTVSPLLTTDRVNRLPQLQSTTITGRRILTHQLGAVLTASAAISLALLAVTALPLGRLELSQFWDTGLSSFNGAGRVYPPISLGLHSLILAGLVLLAGIVAGLIGFALSRTSRSHPALSLALVATLAVALWVISLTGEGAFGYSSLPAALTGSPWSPLALWAGLSLIALLADLHLLWRGQRTDVDDR